MVSGENRLPDGVDAANLQGDALASAPSDRRLLFDLLSAELNAITESDKLTGWTPWLLTGALVTLGWLVFQDVWSITLDLTRIKAAFLAAISILLGSRVVSKMLIDLCDSPEERPRFVLLNASGSPIATLIFAFILAACASLSWAFARYDRPILYGSTAVAVLGTVGAIAALIVMFLRMPMPVRQRPRGPGLLFGAITGTVLLLVPLQLHSSGMFAGASLQEIKAGAALALCSWILMLLARGHGNENSRTKSIRDLRRSLVLDSLSVDEVSRQAGIALRGMWIPDIVWDDMRALHQLISAVERLYAVAFRKMANLRDAVHIDSTEPVTLAAFEKDAFSSAMDLLESTDKEIDKISASYFPLLVKLNKRLVLMSKVVGAGAEDRLALLREIGDAQAVVDAERRRFLAEVRAIQDAWNRWYSEERRTYRFH